MNPQDRPWINGQRLAASMNNASFQLPTKLSLLEATFMGEINGVYTTDFPDQPPAKFDYTNVSNSLNTTLLTTVKSTRVRKVKFNSTVEIVFQNTALIGAENHPMHLHGFNFYVLAQGFGNYNPLVDPGKFNLFSPQQRNTIAVPAGGWAAIRFRADNPVVENGRTPSTKLPPPPADLPKCELSTHSGVEIPYLLILKIFISSLVCYGVMRTCFVLTRARSGYKRVVHQ
ncbi:hypothetical protein DM860_009044 [Cuscuta australis]|uniref:Plastocyanin-like domain-containing protein n=1 Tax=Cuscuta australis TaxID=267555 RepID=A0A328D7Q2_9ASTE|nr:hypothetical protein DM860_009044 [Cuscuta australis]